MSSLPVLRTRLSVRFLSSLPASLPQLFHRCFPFALAFGLSPFLPLSFVRFGSGSDYLASVSSFPLSSRFRLTVASSVLPLCLSTSLLFPVLSDLISHVFFLGSSYSAFCLFPFILPSFAPTAVPLVLPFCSRFRAFPSLPLSFVRFRSVLTTQPSVLSFPFFPFSPVGGSFGAVRFLSSPTFSSSVQPVSMLPFRFRYSASCCSFLRSLSRLTVLPQRLDLVLSVSAAPLCFRFRFGYSAWTSFSQGHPFAPDLRPPRTLLY